MLHFLFKDMNLWNFETGKNTVDGKRRKEKKNPELLGEENGNLYSV